MSGQMSDITEPAELADQRPLVVASLRHADPRPDVAPLSGAVRRDPRASGASAADLAALEHALRLAEEWSGRAVAISAGPPAADETLRRAAALGASVLRVAWPGPDRAGGRAEMDLADLADDERGLARALAAAIGSIGEPAVVVCGDHSTDRGTGALPAYLAHELNAAQALGLVALSVHGEHLIGERRLPGGRRERLRIPKPAVCSVEAAGLWLRRASLPATLAAERAAVPVIPAPDAASARPQVVRVGVARPYRPRTHEVPAPPAGAPRERLLSLTGALVDREPPTVIGPVDAGKAADELMAFFERNGYRASGTPDPGGPREPTRRPSGHETGGGGIP
jgi:electron transfer flavoprotein beta subunit